MQRSLCLIYRSYNILSTILTLARIQLQFLCQYFLLPLTIETIIIFWLKPNLTLAGRPTVKQYCKTLYNTSQTIFSILNMLKLLLCNPYKSNIVQQN